MNLENEGIIIFDTETTGLSFEQDQIIEFSVQMGLNKTDPRETWRIRPTVPISPESQEVHGISMDDLKDCPFFQDYAGKIRDILSKSKIIVGYNVSFDIQMVQGEFKRLGQKPVDLTNKTLVDPFRLWQNCEPRRLENAYKRFIGRELENAHAAENDVIATGEVLSAMIESFQLGDKNWRQIAEICEPERKEWVGPSRHLKWKNDSIVFGFGKYLGKEIAEIAANDTEGYLMWVLNKDFPGHVKQIVQEVLNRDRHNFYAWIKNQYPCDS